MFRRCVYVVMVVGLLSAISIAGPATQPQAHPTSQPATTRPVDPARDKQITAWFSDLANRDAKRRQAARENLMGLGQEDLPFLQSLVKKSHPLAPSQITALQDIVTEIFLAGSDTPLKDSTGFLGVRFETPIQANSDIGENDPPNGVVVIERIPGFAGFRYLQDGDVIFGSTELGGNAFSDPKQLSKYIGSKSVGDTVHLQILRGGEAITVGVTLGARPEWSNPLDIDIDRQLKILRQRQDLADDYWDANFAIYIDNSIS